MGHFFDDKRCLVCLLVLLLGSLFHRGRANEIEACGRPPFSYHMSTWWDRSLENELDSGQYEPLLKAYDFRHTTYPRDRDLNRKRNNLYLGNGQIGMFIDPLGAQALPYEIDAANRGLQETGRSACDAGTGSGQSEELQSAPWKFSRNQHPTINYLGSWVKVPWYEHGNSYGRGHVGLRCSVVPLIEGHFDPDPNRISAYCQQVSLWNNTGTTKFVYDRSVAVTVTAFASWQRPRLAVFHVTLENLTGKALEVGCVAEPIAVHHQGRRLETKCEEGLICLNQARGDLVYDLAFCCGTAKTQGTTLTTEQKIKTSRLLSPGQVHAFTAYFGLQCSANTSNPMQDIKEQINAAKALDYATVLREHCARVHEFWRTSWVLLPWEDLNRLYYRCALIVAGNLRYGKYYPCVSMLTASSYTGFGWAMDQVPLYDFLMQTGRSDYVRNVFQLLKDTLPDDPENRGHQLNYSFDHHPWRPVMVCNASGNYSWLLYEYYRYSGDEAFLEDVAYPVMRSVSNFWSGFADTTGGTYGFWTGRRYNGARWEVHTYDEMVFQLGNQYHWGEQNHVIDAVAPAKWTLAQAAELAHRRGVDRALAQRWLDCRDRLTLPQNARTYLTFRGRDDVNGVPDDPFPQRSVMTSAIFNCVYPTYLPDVDPVKLERTYDVMVAKEDNEAFWNFNYNLQLYPVLARMRMADELERIMIESGLRIDRRLDAKDYAMLGESGDGTGAGYFVMAYGMIPVGINEMLLQTYDGTIRVFPCVLPRWDRHRLCFRRLRAFDGFFVSASRELGQTREIEISASCNRACRLELPLTWSGCSIRDDKGTPIGFTTQRESVRINRRARDVTIVVFQAIPGATYRIVAPASRGD